ncbi:5-methylcytosine-specific restriction endonuclease system specificity protein McrC [Roseococcus thiosulfatophilus]|uniref:5-methylcytosine-specific restriction endonuclease system specificity protein McrC n=1 Tax=Roseococcus thiosulfatophilus TaxID=35813 RepID=UPI001A8E83FE|nr:5-methylcytosine-specific restriction endonuclease system specificity protein McrC [Roseococcus thiosulfatophilus]
MGDTIVATGGAGSDGHAFVGRIPIRNLWLLMLYGSDLYRVLGGTKVALEEMPDHLPDLVAEILAHAVEVRQRRQLSLGYQQRHAVLSRVRGRIDALTTERRQLLSRGLISCHFAELTIDTPRNRFVRAALETVARLGIQPDLAHRCRMLANTMKSMGVSGEAPTIRQMSLDRFGRHDVDDSLMVAAAKLVFDLALPTEAAGTNSFAMPDRDEVWARRLYERAVGGFYEVALASAGWEVRRGSTLEWQTAHATSGIQAILPQMRTDIVLTHPPTGRRIVIDTKFNSILTRGWYKQETLRSGYLYQMYSYLRSQTGRGDALDDSASGLLLHPAVDQKLDEAVTIQGHVVRFATVDLAAPAADIRDQLVRVVQPNASA